MNMPYLHTHQKNAQIGIRYHQPLMIMKQPQAEQQISQPAADVDISTRSSKLTIDQTEALADVDNKGPGRRMNEWADSARQQLAQGVIRRAREGIQMMEIENGGNAFKRIAKQNSNPPQQTVGIKFIPKTPFRVNIDYDPGEVNVDVTKNDPIIDVKINKPIIQHENWRASIYLQQKESISYELLNFNVDDYI